MLWGGQKKKKKKKGRKEGREGGKEGGKEGGREGRRDGKCTHRPMEQNREPRNKSLLIWSIYGKKNAKHKIGKSLFSKWY